MTRREAPTAATPAGVAPGSGLGMRRWHAEQTPALMHQFKRLGVRDDRDAEPHEAFMTLACAMIGWRRLHSSG